MTAEFHPQGCPCEKCPQWDTTPPPPPSGRGDGRTGIGVALVILGSLAMWAPILPFGDTSVSLSGAHAICGSPLGIIGQALSSASSCGGISFAYVAAWFIIVTGILLALGGIMASNGKIR